MRKHLTMTMLGFALGIAGCGLTAGPGAAGPKPLGRVDALSLFAGSTAINLDGVPGADGVSVRVLAYQSSSGKVRSGRIKSGRLQFRLYEGKVSSDTAEILQEWEFFARDMNGFLVRKRGLLGYELALNWGDRKPRTSTITIVLRYLRDDGSVLQSSPAAIRVGK